MLTEPDTRRRNVMRDGVWSWKRRVGVCLFRVCNRFPAAKAVLAKWGLCCKQEWFTNRLANVQAPGGRTLKLASVSENYLSFQLFWLGTRFYEPVTTLVLQELVQPGDTFLDVGANIGFYSLVLTLTRPQIQVVAFEPNPKIHSLLRRNVSANAFHHITCEPVALSDADGTATLHLSQSDHSASLRPEFDEHPAGTIEIPTTTLDTYLSGPKTSPSRRLVIKIDVEGSEKAVLLGARKTLASIKPDIIVEVALGSQTSAPPFVSKLGYRSYSITDQGLVETSAWSPYVRGRFVFLNQLLTARPPEDVAGLFGRIQDQVQRLDLGKTSKLADAVVLQRAVGGAPPTANTASSPIGPPPPANFIW